MSGIIRTFEYGHNTVTLETGIIARQATGSVMVDMDGTVVLATVVSKNDEEESRGFFPLTVNYQERSYAAGKIPGGFIKREGRPSEKETLISRLIDRPLRPLFPEGFMSEVQVIVAVLSINPNVSPDVPAMIGASSALAVSGIPFNGPIGAARVGYIDNQFVLNTRVDDKNKSKLDLLVAGTSHAVLMVESEARELSEKIMLDAVMFGHQQMQIVIQAIEQLKEEVNPTAREWKAECLDQQVVTTVREATNASLAQAYQISDKVGREKAIEQIKNQLVADYCADDREGALVQKDVLSAFSQVEKDLVRGNILAGKARIDGRDMRTVRDIHIDIGVLKRTHGSALFTRGETQALVVATLGTERDAQIIDSIEGESRDAFMLHYNFPPYCVGETGMMTGPKRREIGHGRLAKRGIQAVLPDIEDFPYVIRVVSEITESNGSSSMASICGTSLALMDAGVPIKAPVAGIAMGLIKEGAEYAVLTDILGAEDHLGDMDFKVAGTETGITALQMDIKIEGITQEIMATALEQAREARVHILNVMNQTISKERESISDYAPRIYTIKVHPDKIRDIIGKGGATIRALTEETGVNIDINDDGIVRIATADKQAGQEAIARIEAITEEAEIGKTYAGKVVKIVDFGAFVNFLPGKDGLLHISQISDERINNVADVLSEGQAVQVIILDIDRQGRVRLSMKDVEQDIGG